MGQSSPTHHAQNQRPGRIARTAVIAVFALILQACTVELYSNLDQKQANEIVAALMRSGIPAERESRNDGTMIVSVPKGQFADAMAVLDENGLPRTEFATLGDVFKRDGFVSSPTEERAAMIFGLSQELSRTVSEIDGVLSARVHLVLPQNDPLRNGVVPSSASVFIRHRASVPMNELVPQVKNLIANGTAGLTYDNVSVTLVPVESTPAQTRNEVGFTTFLGMWIHPESVATARVVFFGLIAAVAGLGGWLLSIQMRRRRSSYALSAPSPLPAKNQ